MFSLFLDLRGFIVIIVLLGTLWSLIRAINGLIRGDIIQIILYGFLFFVFGSGTILIPGGIRARSQSQFSACAGNLKNIAAALQLYAKDNNGTYPYTLNILSPQYIRELPTCPTSKKHYHYEQIKTNVSTENPQGVDFVIFCPGNVHKDPATPPDFPRFIGSKGLLANP